MATPATPCLCRRGGCRRQLADRWQVSCPAPTLPVQQKRICVCGGAHDKRACWHGAHCMSAPCPPSKCPAACAPLWHTTSAPPAERAALRALVSGLPPGGPTPPPQKVLHHQALAEVDTPHGLALTHCITRSKEVVQMPPPPEPPGSCYDEASCGSAFSRCFSSRSVVMRGGGRGMST